ncbi:MAG TPA: alpha-glucan family phosphorylase [Candidatus Eremiobacteraeota bacterium]|nr:MAG: Maltodextrin phosphorylase [bacterium ADurb.Bin363]HPZ08554.1 alpha-glucan family phosphorylase [Candidatus Eremiobacteraeota bacterium]
MYNIRTFQVIPSIPESLLRLKELAYNIYWFWNQDALDLFRRLDIELWEKTRHNPVLMLGTIKQETLEARSRDDGFLSHMERVLKRFDDYMANKTSWYKKQPVEKDITIAYFSAEYGMAECLPIYSGGLGVLSGDHLKSASDLGIPLVAVGLLYQQGYFRQYLNADGWQQEQYPENDFYNLPLTLMLNENGSPIIIEAGLPGRVLKAQIWKVQVGRVPLYLMDSNIPQNQNKWDRDITGQLYGGGTEMRICQEILLGIGGVRVLQALGIKPDVFHINEGHSAFLCLERMRMLIEEKGLTFLEAYEATMVSNIFTTHTPVPAGIDIFSLELMDKYFGNYYSRLKISRDDFLGLGRKDSGNHEEPFNMAVLALGLSGRANGVSRLHSEVSRKMWMSIYPDVPVQDIPISSLTNGIHNPSWISRDMAGLFDRYIGPRWRTEPIDQEIWDRGDNIPGEELWRTHERRRERLVAFARKRLRQQLERRGASRHELEQAEEVLDPEAFTIGFARRFATYKRATLILKDPLRLEKILSNKDRPVQIIIAGKAHPQDTAGKKFIQQIVHQARHEPFRNHIVFIEDYDMEVAHYMVTGSDIWLNTPRRPLEASGTSGMKAALNGCINVSTLDGWWCEGYERDTGWAIGCGENYDDHNYQDDIEASALYDLLEGEIIPLFYERGRSGMPHKWVNMMKNSMRKLIPRFNTNRMVSEYASRFYFPSADFSYRLREKDYDKARDLSAWKARIREHWYEIKVEHVHANTSAEIKVGKELNVQARIHLGALTPEDIKLDIYYGPLDIKAQIASGIAIPMDNVEELSKNVYLFSGFIPCMSSGRHGFVLRLLPYHEDLCNPYAMNLIMWI